MEFTKRKAFAIKFRDLSRWDTKYFSARLGGLYPKANLGDFIQERSERVNLFEYPDQTFTILGVNNIDGVFHAYETKGEKINQPYKRVYGRDIFYNPYRVNVGSIGIVPDDLGENFTSPAYVVFSVDEPNFIPELLELILRSNWYNPVLRAATAGSVRQNLTFDLLKSLKIPLPPFSIQQKIMNYWQRTQDEIAGINQQILNLEKIMEANFIDELGLFDSKSTNPSKSFTLLWSELERWSVLFNQFSNLNLDLNKGYFAVVPIADIISYLQYGSSKKANTTGNGTPIIRMNNIVKGALVLDDLKHIELTESERQALLLSEGDILFNRTNSKELVGKCAVFHEQSEYVFASYLIRIAVDNTKVFPGYLALALNSLIGRQQIYLLSRQIGGQANINSDEITSISVPLPPLEIQHKIFGHIEVQRENIRALMEKTKGKTEQAKKEIEAMLLGEKQAEGG